MTEPFKFHRPQLFPHRFPSLFCIPWEPERGYMLLTPSSASIMLRVCSCVPSCFSRVQLCVTLWTAACQAPLSMEFSRILEWVAMPSSRGCSPPRDQTRASRHLHWQAGSSPPVPPGKFLGLQRGASKLFPEADRLQGRHLDSNRSLQRLAVTRHP